MHRRDTRAVTMRLGVDLANAIAGATFVPLEGVAHNPWDERPGEALVALGEFLDAPLGAGANSSDAPVVATGVRTVLFSQIDGGDVQLQREHRAIVRRAAEQHGGEAANGEGGGMTATFTSAVAALDAAREIQRACAARSTDGRPASRPRIGVNAGETLRGASSPRTTTSTAEHITAHAAAGEILVTNVVRELCAGGPFLFASHGTVSLEGFEEPVHVYEVPWE
jgi:hypothetical protein